MKKFYQYITFLVFYFFFLLSNSIFSQSPHPTELWGTSNQITLDYKNSTYETITRIGNKNSFAKFGSDCSLKFQLAAPDYWRHRIVEQSRFFQKQSYVFFLLNQNFKKQKNMKDKKTKIVKMSSGLPVFYAHAAGIDIGDTEHYVAIPDG